jgi:flagellar biosynthetic protein FliQ
MAEQDIIDALRAFLWAAVVMGAPLMIAALIIGVVVGLFQALTSIQEMTLTFAPKLVVMLAVLYLTAGHMSRILVSLFDNQIIPFIIAG